MREYTKMVVVLTVVSLLSGGVLAETYRFAQPKIEKMHEERFAQSVFDVVRGATRFEEVDSAELSMFRVFDEGEVLVGYAFVAEPAGFQGAIRVMVGVDGDFTKITGMSVLEHSETPGLGSRIAEPVFGGQFIGKSVSDEFKVEGDIDAVTGATISSTAVANGLKDGIERARIIIEGEKRRVGNGSTME